MLTVKIKKIKLEADKPDIETEKNLLKKLGLKADYLSKKVMFSIFNNLNGVSQEVVMLYFGELFKKYQKLFQEDDEQEVTHFKFDQTFNEITAEIEFKDKASQDKLVDEVPGGIRWACYDIKVSDWLKGHKNGQKIKDKIKDKYVRDQANQRNGFRIRLNKIKEHFDDWWEESVNMTILAYAQRAHILIDVRETEQSE